MKKKFAAAGIVVFVLLVLFFPIKAHLDDGGSVVYASIARVYKITKIKTFDNVGMTITMKEGLQVELFGKEVYHHIDKEYLLEQKEWGEENGTCYFDAKIVEITEGQILVESTTDGVGAIRAGTPVAFSPVLVGNQNLLVQGLEAGDEIRIMYNDKRVQIDRPQWRLWLEVVFEVYPLEKSTQ